MVLTAEYDYHTAQVSDKSIPSDSSQQRGQKKKKGKGTSWRSIPLDIAPYSPKVDRSKSGRSPRKSKNSSRASNREVQPVPLTLEESAAYARQQIEYYFSVQNLCSDMYLRSCMDEDGYVPVVYIAQFNRIASFHSDMPSLCEALQQSKVLDFDKENEKVRASKGWEYWLLPNADGGRGVQRWVLVDNSSDGEDENGFSDTASDTTRSSLDEVSNNRSRSRSNSSDTSSTEENDQN